MNVKWNLLLPAVLLTGYLLISRGAPIVPVLAGCVVTVVFVVLRSLRSRLSTKTR